MTYQNLGPDKAKELVDSGWTYVDVRTVEEFEAGHVPGAYNVPVALRDASGRMAPNAGFRASIEALFPKDAKLVIGCAAGGRSMRACEELAPAGYGALVNMEGGFGGMRDAAGRLVCPGWTQHGFPTAARPEPGRTWAEVKTVRARSSRG
jgi:rhodanese-related sulfurtransferase